MPKDTRDTAIYVAYEDHQPFDPAEPERNLLRAILQNALSDLRKVGEPRRRAEEYLLSDEDDYIFSFRSVCGYLNVDPKKILVVHGLNPANWSEGAPGRGEKNSPPEPQFSASQSEKAAK